MKINKVTFNTIKPIAKQIVTALLVQAFLCHGLGSTIEVYADNIASFSTLSPKIAITGTAFQATCQINAAIIQARNKTGADIVPLSKKTMPTERKKWDAQKERVVLEWIKKKLPYKSSPLEDDIAVLAKQINKTEEQTSAKIKQLAFIRDQYIDKDNDTLAKVLNISKGAVKRRLNWFAYTRWSKAEKKQLWHAYKKGITYADIAQLAAKYKKPLGIVIEQLSFLADIDNIYLSSGMGALLDFYGFGDKERFYGQYQAFRSFINEELELHTNIKWQKKEKQNLWQRYQKGINAQQIEQLSKEFDKPISAMLETLASLAVIAGIYCSAGLQALDDNLQINGSKFRAQRGSIRKIIAALDLESMPKEQLQKLSKKPSHGLKQLIRQQDINKHDLSASRKNIPNKKAKPLYQLTPNHPHLLKQLDKMGFEIDSEFYHWTQIWHRKNTPVLFETDQGGLPETWAEIKNLGHIKVKGRLLPNGDLYLGERFITAITKYKDAGFKLEVINGMPVKITFLRDSRQRTLLPIFDNASGNILKFYSARIPRAEFKSLRNVTIINQLSTGEGRLEMGGGRPSATGVASTGKNTAWAKFGTEFAQELAAVKASGGVVFRCTSLESALDEEFALFYKKSEQRYVSAYWGKLHSAEWNTLDEDYEIRNIQLSKDGSLYIGGTEFMNFGLGLANGRATITEIRYEPDSGKAFPVKAFAVNNKMMFSLKKLHILYSIPKNTPLDDFSQDNRKMRLVFEKWSDKKLQQHIKGHLDEYIVSEIRLDARGCLALKGYWARFDAFPYAKVEAKTIDDKQCFIKFIQDSFGNPILDIQENALVIDIGKPIRRQLMGKSSVHVKAQKEQSRFRYEEAQALFLQQEYMAARRKLQLLFLKKHISPEVKDKAGGLLEEINAIINPRQENARKNQAEPRGRLYLQKAQEAFNAGKYRFSVRLCKQALSLKYMPDQIKQELLVITEACLPIILEDENKRYTRMLENAESLIAEARECLEAGDYKTAQRQSRIVCRQEFIPEGIKDQALEILGITQEAIDIQAQENRYTRMLQKAESRFTLAKNFVVKKEYRLALNKLNLVINEKNLPSTLSRKAEQLIDTCKRELELRKELKPFSLKAYYNERIELSEEEKRSLLQAIAQDDARSLSRFVESCMWLAKETAAIFANPGYDNYEEYLSEATLELYHIVLDAASLNDDFDIITFEDYARKRLIVFVKALRNKSYADTFRVKSLETSLKAGKDNFSLKDILADKNAWDDDTIIGFIDRDADLYEDPEDYEDSWQKIHDDDISKAIISPAL